VGLFYNLFTVDLLNDTFPTVMVMPRDDRMIFERRVGKDVEISGLGLFSGIPTNPEFTWND
jgi:hypothetical protein